MSISLSKFGNNIGNYVENGDEISPLTIADIIVQSASNVQMVATLNYEGSLLGTFTVRGQWELLSDVVGLSFMDIKTNNLANGVVSSYTFENTDSDTGLPQREEVVYSPPVTWVDVLRYENLSDTPESLLDEYSGDDYFVGDKETPSSDSAYGYAGDDQFVMTYGNPWSEKFYGGEGVDTAIIESDSSHWRIEATDTAWDEVYQINQLSGFFLTDTRYEGTDTYGEQGHILQLVDVERVQFTDRVIELTPISSTNTNDEVSDEATDDQADASSGDQDPVVVTDPIDALVSDDVSNGSYTLDLIADVFGTVLHLKGLTETVTSSSHTIEYNGQTFN